MPDTSATPTAPVPCDHDEPRGCTACALCRRSSCSRCLPTRALEITQAVRAITQSQQEQSERPATTATKVSFTMRLPADLHAAVKARALAEDRNVTQAVRVALRAYVDR